MRFVQRVLALSARHVRPFSLLGLDMRMPICMVIAVIFIPGQLQLIRIFMPQIGLPGLLDTFVPSRF